jgi:hypothetical protein
MRATRHRQRDVQAPASRKYDPDRSDPPNPFESGRSRDHDLVGESGPALGQIENGFLRQLLGVIGPGSTHEDNHPAGADNVQVANPTTGSTLDMTFDSLGQFSLTLKPLKKALVRPCLMRGHWQSPSRSAKLMDHPVIATSSRH